MKMVTLRVLLFAMAWSFGGFDCGFATLMSATTIEWIQARQCKI
jgi:hypothetical protein